MSRLPPMIKQHIDGKPVAGFNVKPITLNGVVYKVASQHLLDEAGSIVGMDWTLEAVDAEAKTLWKTVYFHQEFTPGLETDVQEIYPIDFSFNDNEIMIEHERESMFRISLDGTLAPEKSA